jgi:hypothetical protein
MTADHERSQPQRPRPAAGHSPKGDVIRAWAAGQRAEQAASPDGKTAFQREHDAQRLGSIKRRVKRRGWADTVAVYQAALAAVDGDRDRLAVALGALTGLSDGRIVIDAMEAGQR